MQHGLSANRAIPKRLARIFRTNWPRYSQTPTPQPYRPRIRFLARPDAAAGVADSEACESLWLGIRPKGPLRFARPNRHSAWLRPSDSVRNPQPAIDKAQSQIGPIKRN